MIRKMKPQKKKLKTLVEARAAVTPPLGAHDATPMANSRNQAGRVMNSLAIQEG